MTARLLSVLALVVAVAAPALAQETSVPGRCAVDEDATVDVLVLLDQSGSLNNSDPDGKRVTGAQAVVRSYATLAERVAQVRVQVAGFGTGFTGSDWQVLDDGSQADVLGEVAEVGEQNADFHTDYVYALDGARTAFEDSTADCRILFWFTDGAHDLDETLLPNPLDRFYSDVPVTTDNVAEVEGLMPALICDAGGLADQLGSLGVSTQVMLLGSGSSMADASARVLRGMGGDPGFECGPGNGSFEDVGSADELPFRMACLPQPGALAVPVTPAGGTLLLTDQSVAAGGVPAALITNLRVVARGPAGSPPALGRSTLAGVTSFSDEASGTAEASLALTGDAFEVELSGVNEACAFASAVAPQPTVTALTPTLYRQETGEFKVEAVGPHGRLQEADLSQIVVSATAGRVAATDDGWVVTVRSLPATDTVDLGVTATLDPLPSVTVSEVFPLSEQLHAPRIATQPAAVVGEGAGPFQVTLDVDGQDGGELCLDTASGLTLPDADGQTVAVEASFAGDDCLTVPAGPGQSHTLDVELDRQDFVSGTIDLAYRSMPAARPDTSEQGVVSVALELTPVANTALVAGIVAGLLAVLAGLMWATLYGVNRLVARIPDPRANHVRFADFTAEVRPSDDGAHSFELVEAPTDRDLRSPRRSPAELRAGRLSLVRRVPLWPWRAPYAELAAGADVVAADLGRDVMQRTVVGERSVVARPADALGPIVALGLSAAHLARLDDGTSQKVAGVLLIDVREAKGRDATAVAGEVIGSALDRIATEFAVHDQRSKERTTGT